VSKRVRVILLVILGAVFLFSLYKLLSYYGEKNKNQQITAQAEQYVEIPKTEEKEQPIKVDFDAMHAVNQDIQAWLYNPDSKINYPVVQSTDNDYYLHRMLNGEYNANGTLFMDYAAAPDFTSRNTLIYGHNMRSGYMFGELGNYKKQDYYDAHPFMYLLTPTQDYRLELIAGAVVEEDDELYAGELTDAILSRLISSSRFTSSYTVSDTGNFVTLSTCSYEYENARFVVIGQLVPIEP
jgi:sortase B